ncbi:MAG: Antitoxin Phd YefM, type toxin-antitoxin system [Capsulimonas sp.]|jgi:prevent-host-death family protein|nr:Antitoxin Phd YefM, type toxin-antitoxin system [Capsulimonas sp.]
MVTINATEARNNIGQLWDTASREPVTVESAGKPIAVVLSPEEYRRLTRQRKPRQSGSMRHLFKGNDVNELLATPIDDVFAEYMA